jgi:hypothetical protein
MNAKKDQLKTLFKPIIKECIKELILEEGVLSSMISEVHKAKIPSSNAATTEAVIQAAKPKVDNKAKIDEAKRKIYAALGSDNYSHIFENIEPLSNYEAGQSTSPAHDPLSGKDPSDPGVDISGIPGMNMWKTLVEDKKR